MGMHPMMIVETNMHIRYPRIFCLKVGWWNDAIFKMRPFNCFMLLKFEADCSCDIPPNLTNVIKILYILKGYSVNEIKT